MRTITASHVTAGTRIRYAGANLTVTEAAAYHGWYNFTATPDAAPTQSVHFERRHDALVQLAETH